MQHSDSPTSFDEIARLVPRGEDRFVGRLPAAGWARPFGGFLLAQLLNAACETVEAGRPVHALQAQFVRAGHVDHPIDYRVERTIDGRRFSSRRVVASQAGRVLVEALVSFQVEAVGFEHHTPRPDVPGPDGLPSEARLREEALERPGVSWVMSPIFADVPIEMRPVQPRNFVDPEPQPARLDFWLRPDQPIAPANRRAFVACLSDTMLLSTTLMPHGVTWMTTRIEGATLNHGLWIHAEPPLDDWMLWSIEGAWSGGTRGLARGALWSAKGALIATVMQEGLIRPL